MIVESSENYTIPFPLHAYFGMDDSGMIHGGSYYSAVVMKNEVDELNYRDALRIKYISVTSTPQPSRGTEDRLTVYSEIRRQIEALREMPEGDELGLLRPADHAVASATAVIFRMMASTAKLPMPTDISLDRDGGIRTLWENDSRSLELVCPSVRADRPYIYFSDDDDYRIAYDTTAPRLNRLMSWLTGSDSQFPK